MSVSASLVSPLAIFLGFSEATRDNVVCNRRCINKVKLDLIYNEQISVIIIIIVVGIGIIDDDNNNNNNICSSGGSRSSTDNVDTFNHLSAMFLH